MLHRILKKVRRTPEGQQPETPGAGSDAFKRAKAAEETREGEIDELRSEEDVPVEEREPEPERAAEPPPKKEAERERYYDEYEEEKEEEYEEEESPGGVFISGKKIRGGFKIFGITLLSIFLLPWILSFGISIVVIVSLIVFPIVLSLFPIFLVALFVLVIVAPLVMPILIIYFLITERGRLLINSEGNFFWVDLSVAYEEAKKREASESLEGHLTEGYLRPEEHLH
ncbi:MAG: hypothetical protein ACYSWY_07390 [Planctomycetota bacterium]|jgi:hypothetical protein